MSRSSRLLVLLLAFFVSQVAAQAGGKAPTAAQKLLWMKQAMSAAPAHIAKDATILAPGADGKMMELRKAMRYLRSIGDCRRWSKCFRRRFTRMNTDQKEEFTCV